MRSPWLLAALSLSLLSPTAAADTLPLVSVVEGQQASGWWVEQGALSPIEAGLASSLGGDVVLVDPAGARTRPRVSRIYRVAQLSDQNAVNLAGLHGADRALVGAATYRTVNSSQRLGLEGVEVSLRVRWLAVPSGAVLLETNLRAAGWAARAPDARAQAEAEITRDLSTLMVGVAQNLSGQVGLERAEPFVAVRGLWDLRALRAFEKALRAAPGVQGARLAWIAEGVLAFDLNPGSAEDAAFVRRVVDGIASSPPDGMQVLVTEAGLEVRRAAPKAAEGEE